MKEQKKDSFLKQTFVTQTHGYLDVSQKRDLWRKIAFEYDGKFTIRHNSGNELEIFKLKIPYKKYTIELSESDTRPLKFYLEFDLIEKFNFYISWEDTIEKFLKLFGKQDIVIGEKIFDDKFLIQSDRPDLLKKLLSDSKIKRLIIKHNIYSLICEYDKHTGINKLLSVINRTTDSLETIKELIKLHFLIIDKLEENRMMK